jgi:predicted aspartyl protease
VVSGEVTSTGEVTIQIPVHGAVWPAVIDTGFNGDLELPLSLFDAFEPEYQAEELFELAAGQSVVQDVYVVRFPFDDLVMPATATFVESDTILIGTGLMRRHRLIIDFVARTILLERIASGQ